MASKGDLQAALASLRAQHECGGGWELSLLLRGGARHRSFRAVGSAAGTAGRPGRRLVRASPLRCGSGHRNRHRVHRIDRGGARRHRGRGAASGGGRGEEARRGGGRGGAPRRRRPLRRGCSSELAAARPGEPRGGVDDLELGCEPAARVADLGAALQATLGGDWSQGWPSTGSSTTRRPRSPNSTSETGRGSG